jgi:FAD/FMN-containing dehydrogenase
MTVKRAASIDNGVLIVLTELRQLTIASDHEIASLGPGITWIDVYDWVQKFNRTIVGGRYAPVGVSGLLLGGGISFHSGQYGWAANSVLNFEVVTSDGKVIYANRTSHSDLFWALKGGGSNFGIVTRFDVKTHPSGLIHGGLVSFEPSNVGHAFKALESFSEPGGGVDNPKAALLPNIFIDPASGNQSAGIFGFVDSADGSALNNFTENSSVSTVKLRTYADFIAEGAGSGAPGSFR